MLISSAVPMLQIESAETGFELILQLTGKWLVLIFSGSWNHKTGFFLWKLALITRTILYYHLVFKKNFVIRIQKVCPFPEIPFHYFTYSFQVKVKRVLWEILLLLLFYNINFVEFRFDVSVPDFLSNWNFKPN